jgi:prepilin-type N-terminal cleavage/methylation domain-containing protein
MKRYAATGFSLLELLVVVTIGSIVTVMALPMTINATKSYRLGAAVSAAAGAIQSTRYLAIMQGYPGTTAAPYGYEIIFTPATNSYQVYNMVPGATTFSAVGTAVPISGPDAVTIGRTATFEFGANGTVYDPSGLMTLQITNSIGGSNTINLTSVGNVTVTSP